MSHKLVSLYIGEGEYYTRTDADNVIAEKDKEIVELKGQVNGFKNRSNLWHFNAVEEHKKLVKADKVIAELKADYKEAVDRLQTANLIKDEQKAKADKLLSCLKSLVMSDLIKECTEKASSIEMVKEYDLWNSKQNT